jgi:hypothetical protein
VQVRKSKTNIIVLIKDYSPDDTIGDLKKLIAAKTGTPAEKIVLKKWYPIHFHYIYSVGTQFIKIS